jgi:hypothetical protein
LINSSVSFSIFANGRPALPCEARTYFFQESGSFTKLEVYDSNPGEEWLLEQTDSPGLIRRIVAGLFELAKSSVLPLRRRAVRRWLLRTCVLLYIVSVLWLHYIGYRSWHPEFHRVRETIRDSALDSIPLALFGTVLAYFYLLRDRDWI